MCDEVNEPISCQWSISLRPENTRKLEVFCVFRGDRKRTFDHKWNKHAIVCWDFRTTLEQEAWDLRATPCP